MRGVTVQRDAGDRFEAGLQVVSESVLMLLDSFERADQALTTGGTGPAQAGDEVNRGGCAGQELVGQGAELEALGYGVGGRQQLVGLQGLEELGYGGQRPEVRAEELVRRADEEVGVRRIDRSMRGQMDPVDVDQRAHLVSLVG